MALAAVQALVYIITRKTVTCVPCHTCTGETSSGIRALGFLITVVRVHDAFIIVRASQACSGESRHTFAFEACIRVCALCVGLHSPTTK